MSNNPYEDFLAPGGAQPAPTAERSAAGANPYADFVPVPSSAERAAAAAAAKGPATAADRLQAGEGALIGGSAYALASIPDAALNAIDVGKATLGSAYGLTHTTETADPIRTPGGLYHYL